MVPTKGRQPEHYFFSALRPSPSGSRSSCHAVLCLGLSSYGRRYGGCSKSDVSPPSEDEPRNEEEMFCQTYGGESNIKPPPLGNVTQVKYLSKVCGSLLLENAQRLRVNLGKRYKA